MTIELQGDLESSVQAAMHSGRFASVNDAISAAVGLLLRELGQQAVVVADKPGTISQGFIGALRQDADLLDQAVAHAMKVREERPWRLKPVE